MIVHSAKCCVVWIEWDETCSPSKWGKTSETNGVMTGLADERVTTWKKSDAALHVGLRYHVYVSAVDDLIQSSRPNSLMIGVRQIKLLQRSQRKVAKKEDSN